MKHSFNLAFAFVLLMGSLQMASFCADEVVPAKNDKKSVVDKKTEKPAETWKQLFDGESLAGWSMPVYGGDGVVDVQKGNIVIERGEMMTGIRYEKEFPTNNYELRYEAQRTDGYDFFAACTFPVKKRFCTFINGGWGGGVIGLSNVGGYDASENETTSYFEFKDNTWYRFRLRVTEKKIQVWITEQDKEGKWTAEKSGIDFDIEDKNVSTRMEVDQYKPLGFCTWSTAAHLRNIEYRTDVLTSAAP